MRHLHTADLYREGFGPAPDATVDEYGGEQSGGVAAAPGIASGLYEPDVECSITPNSSRLRASTVGQQPEGSYTGFFPSRLAGQIKSGDLVKIKTGPSAGPTRYRVTTIGDWGSDTGWDLEVGLEESQEDF